MKRFLVWILNTDYGAIFSVGLIVLLMVLILVFGWNI